MGKVLGIAGSPRKNGNSDTLLESFLKGARESGHDVEKVYAADKLIGPCDEGNTCFKTGVCHINDDMQDIYKRLLGADYLVISTPTFFMGPPAQLKAMIDRCQSLWAKRFILKRSLRDDDKKRSGFLLGTSGLDKKDAFIGTKEIIKAFFYVLGFKYKSEILVFGVDDADDLKTKKSGALNEAYELGQNL